mmetsp:Transcript_35610/g.56765  ORF Transcript_35610/g.56765 Transcript_35610/m.56765 type:complete len:144 (-) Transcript_35610:324-755(-)
MHRLQQHARIRLATKGAFKLLDMPHTSNRSAGFNFRNMQIAHKQQIKAMPLEPPIITIVMLSSRKLPLALFADDAPELVKVIVFLEIDPKPEALAVEMVTVRIALTSLGAVQMILFVLPSVFLYLIVSLPKHGDAPSTATAAN